MEQVAYFTLEDRKGKPKGVVCLMEIGTTLGYGISLCSATDKFKVGSGRVKARERAKSAIFVGDYYLSEQSQIEREEAWKALHELCFFDFHRTVKLTKGWNDQCKCGILDDTFDNFVHKFTSPVYNNSLLEPVSTESPCCRCSCNANPFEEERI